MFYDGCCDFVVDVVEVLCFLCVDYVFGFVEGVEDGFVVDW